MLSALDTFANLSDGANNLPAYVSLTTEEQLEYNSYATDLETYASTEVMRFIIGERDLSTYDDFLETLYTMGLQEMTDIYQTAYDRAQEKLAALD